MPIQYNTLLRTEAVTAVNSTDAFTAPTGGINGDAFLRAHHFCSIEFTDSTGAAATPGAGTYTIGVKTKVNPNTAETIPDGATVDATAAQINLSVAAPIVSWVVTTDSITTATHYIFRHTSHRS